MAEDNGVLLVIDMAKLVVLSEGFTGRTCELKVERTTVGRLEDNQFQIPEPSVSSHHCEIILRGNDILIKDLDSTNGTFIDGDKITEAVLKPGQVLRLGQIELRLDDGTAAAPAPKKQVNTIQGVKLNELDASNKPRIAPTDVFKKKSNQVNKYFIIGMVALGLIVVALLVIAILKSPGTQ